MRHPLIKMGGKNPLFPPNNQTRIFYFFNLKKNMKESRRNRDKERTRKAHKNRVFIINPLCAKSVWVKVKFWVMVKFWVKVEFWVTVKFWVKVKFGVKVNVCVWLHLASPGVSVDSTDGASNGLIR